MEPDMEPPMESPKRMKFSLPFFRRNRDKQLTPQKAEVAERKLLVEEGHRFLAEATDLINQNHDLLVHRNGLGYEQMLGDRWAELYSSAPSGKKLTKGRLIPEEFRDKSRTLLDDVQGALQDMKIDDGSAGPSSQQNHEAPHEDPPSLKREQSVRREPSHRRRELKDDGPVPPRDVQFDTTPKPPRESDPSHSSHKTLSRQTRDDKGDRHVRQTENIPSPRQARDNKDDRHTRQVEPTDPAPRLDDRKPSVQSKHSTSERTRHREDDDRRRRREDGPDDRYREDRYRDDYRREDRDRRQDRDNRYYEDRYSRNDRNYKDDRYDRNDRYRDDRYRDGRRRDDRYYDDRRRDDRRRYDRYYDDRRGDDRPRRDDRRYEDRYREDRYKGDRYRGDRRGDDRDRRQREGRREGDDRRRDRREENDQHEVERQSSQRHQGEEPTVPVAMSPTFIPYPEEDEKPHHRSSRRRRDRDQTPPRSRDHSPSQKAEPVTDHELLSPDPDSRRTSHQSQEEPAQ